MPRYAYCAAISKHFQGRIELIGEAGTGTGACTGGAGTGTGAGAGGAGTGAGAPRKEFRILVAVVNSQLKLAHADSNFGYWL